MIASTVDWYVNQEVPLQAAILSAGTTLLVLFLGVWLNAWANRRNTLNASRDSQKLEIYKTMLEKIDAASDAQIAADGYLRAAVMAVENYADLTSQGLHATPPKHRFLEFSKLHHEQGKRLGEIHILLEQWAIIDSRLKVFRLAFGFQGDATRSAFSELSQSLIRMLPVEKPEGGLYPYGSHQGRHLAELSQLAEKYHRESGLLGAYVSDLNVELQPLLLGHLFGRRVTRRNPPDPSQATIRLDRYKQITRDFEQTEFFRRGAELDREIRARHQKAPWWRIR